MFKHTSKLTLLIASGLMASFVAQANKGAKYYAPPEKQSFPHNFFLEGGVNYLLATHNELPFAAISTLTSPTTISATKYYLNPNYKFGYNLSAGYLISEVYDIQASWLQLNTNNTESVSALGPNTLFQTMSGFGGSLGGITAGESFSAKTSETLNYQQLDANIGQFHDVGKSLNTRIFAGIRYASIVDNVKNTYSITGVSPFNETFDSTYNGAGPELGIDAQYEIWGTLSMVGNFTAAFLVGTLTSTSSFPETVGVTDSVSTNSVPRVVPGIDTKIGLHAGIPWGSYNDQFFIEGGYQLAYYFNVVNQMAAVEELLVYTDNYSSVSINGPYLNFGARF